MTTSDLSAPPDWTLEQDGPRVERYLLGPELGRGGMGRVHLAWDPILQRMVALKLLLGNDPEMHLRLLREARSQARLEHPHICRIHDLGEEDGRPYIAMQLVSGTSLSELRPELGFKEMAAIMADVAGAVHAAHRSGLIHRDLKPANILVEGGGPYHPFVVDFGLARDFQAMDQTLAANARLYTARALWSFCKYFLKAGQSERALLLACFLSRTPERETWVRDEADAMIAGQAPALGAPTLARLQHQAGGMDCADVAAWVKRQPGVPQDAAGAG